MELTTAISPGSLSDGKFARLSNDEGIFKGFSVPASSFGAAGTMSTGGASATCSLLFFSYSAPV